MITRISLVYIQHVMYIQKEEERKKIYFIVQQNCKAIILQ